MKSRYTTVLLYPLRYTKIVFIMNTTPDESGIKQSFLRPLMCTKARWIQTSSRTSQASQKRISAPTLKLHPSLPAAHHLFGCFWLTMLELIYCDSCTNSSTLQRKEAQSHHILYEKSFNLKPSCNEVHYTIFQMLRVKIMRCGELHCQKVFELESLFI